jgi:hypothetical protein
MISAAKLTPAEDAAGQLGIRAIRSWSKRAAVAKAGMISKAGTFEIVEAQRLSLKQ